MMNKQTFLLWLSSALGLASGLAVMDNTVRCAAHPTLGAEDVQVCAAGLEYYWMPEYMREGQPTEFTWIFDPFVEGLEEGALVDTYDENFIKMHRVGERVTVRLTMPKEETSGATSPVPAGPVCEIGLGGGYEQGAIDQPCRSCTFAGMTGGGPDERENALFTADCTNLPGGRIITTSESTFPFFYPVDFYDPEYLRAKEQGESGSNSVDSCADGYTCWEDNAGLLWAKKDSPASGMDCSSVCFAAFSGGHTCKQGVSSPTNLTSSGLAEGLSFNCDGIPNKQQCWGGQSPSSLSGLVLVSGDSQPSKYCYYPSEETLSCDVPVDYANCFGDRPASVCPCVQEEETIITESKRWRLYTHADYDQNGKKWSWDLNNIYFYSSSDCTGPSVSMPEGTTFSDSGNAGGSSGPEGAFGDNPGKWGGRRDSPSEGNLWLAIEFPRPVQVGCVKFDQSSHAENIKLQAKPTSSTTWKTVKSVTDGTDGANMISVLEGMLTASPTDQEGEEETVITEEEEEETMISESKRWRLYTHSDYDQNGKKKWSWDLNNIFFYSSSDCTGPSVFIPEGATFSDSGNGGGSFGPEGAFGGNPGKWGGRWDSPSEGNLWIAIEFPRPVQVGCVKFDQSSHAETIKLQATPTSSIIWKTVKSVTGATDGTNMISALEGLIVPTASLTDQEMAQVEKKNGKNFLW